MTVGETIKKQQQIRRQEMKYPQALTALIDMVHADNLRCHIPIQGYEAPPTRDESALNSEQIRIAATVGRDLIDHLFFNDHSLEFGVFDNCREQGLTITDPDSGWTFCVYQHRNSDNICVEGCPTADVKHYGPYGGDDKYDVLYSTHWGDYEGAANAIAVLIRHARCAYGSADREYLRNAVA